MGPRAGRPDLIRAICCYFDFAGDPRRPANDRRFRELLELPLTAVELCFGGRSELRDEDADALIRIPVGDVLWQKELLLDIAVNSLPADGTRLEWLDGDPGFADPGWSERANSPSRAAPSTKGDGHLWRGQVVSAPEERPRPRHPRSDRES